MQGARDYCCTKITRQKPTVEVYLTQKLFKHNFKGICTQVLPFYATFLVLHDIYLTALVTYFTDADFNPLIKYDAL